MTENILIAMFVATALISFLMGGLCLLAYGIMLLARDEAKKIKFIRQ